MSPRIILDISRLLSRIFHATPTGVDRVEMAYARGFLATAGDRLDFAAVHPLLRYGRLPTNLVRRFLDRTEERWELRGAGDPWEHRRFAASMLYALRPRARPRHRTGCRTVYVQSSPHHLTKPSVVRSILDREDARFVCLVHDLIPLEYPEYARPDGAELHRRRIDTVVRLADGIVANSHATMTALHPWLKRHQRDPAVAVAHLGTQNPEPRVRASSSNARPYFVCIGTIEPRKNHLLLLNLWRKMATEHGGDAVPRLILIGRRGWENEQIVDMLERCPALVGCVEEKGGVSDGEARSLLERAKGLLLPSFAEGYGMPVTEALELGVPVLCSDIPALREAGGDVPLFLDPLDGPAWEKAIADLADPSDAAGLLDRHRRRLATWERPTWENHISIVHDLIGRLP